VRILEIPALESYLYSLPCRTQLSTDNWLSPRLAAISHQPPNFLFTGWLTTELYCKSKSHCNWRSVSQSWCRAPSWAHDQILFITVWQLRSCFCRTLSLTRGWVCLLYMLLALASAFFLGSEYLDAGDHILLSQIRDFPFRLLLRLAGSRWRYSTPLPHGLLCDCYVCNWGYIALARTA
jgi:hypothetical protein